MVMIQERDSRDTRLFNSKFQDDNLWHCYSKSSLNHEKMESRILQHIEHTVLSKSNFNQMKWSVQCVNGNKKDAIHYFTDLYKYRSESEFRSARKSNEGLDLFIILIFSIMRKVEIQFQSVHTFVVYGKSSSNQLQSG